MEKRNVKFGVGIAVVLVTCGWLAVSGFDEAMSYYMWADELMLEADKYQNERLRVAGFVVDGSIQRQDNSLQFELEHNGTIIPVKYVGTAPVPDTFMDGANTVVEGTYLKAGHVEAHTIQAKCASKYESNEYESVM